MKVDVGGFYKDYNDGSIIQVLSKHHGFHDEPFEFGKTPDSKYYNYIHIVGDEYNRTGSIDWNSDWFLESYYKEITEDEVIVEMI